MQNKEIKIKYLDSKPDQYLMIDQSQLLKIPYFQTYFSTKLETNKDIITINYSVEVINFVLWFVKNKHQLELPDEIRSYPFSPGIPEINSKFKDCETQIIELIQFASEYCMDDMLRLSFYYCVELMRSITIYHRDYHKTNTILFVQFTQRFSLNQINTLLKIALVHNIDYGLCGLIKEFCGYLCDEDRLDYIMGCESLEIFDHIACEPELVLKYAEKIGNFNILMLLDKYRIGYQTYVSFLEKKTGIKYAIFYPYELNSNVRGYAENHVVLKSIDPLHYHVYQRLTDNYINLVNGQPDTFYVPFSIRTEVKLGQKIYVYCESYNTRKYITCKRGITKMYVKFNQQMVDLSGISDFEDLLPSRFRMKFDQPLPEEYDFYYLFIKKM